MYRAVSSDLPDFLLFCDENSSTITVSAYEGGYFTLQSRATVNSCGEDQEETTDSSSVHILCQ